MSFTSDQHGTETPARRIEQAEDQVRLHQQGATGRLHEAVLSVPHQDAMDVYRQVARHDAQAHQNSLVEMQSGYLTMTPELGRADLSQRVADAAYPRITQAWNPADNLHEDPEKTMARHDQLFAAPEALKMKWKSGPDGGQSTELDPSSVDASRAMRGRLLEQNPNMVTLAEIRYHDAPPGTFPKDSPFWKYDAGGNRIQNPDYKEYDMLDFSNPQFQKHVADQAAAAVKSGAVDGVMLDWFNDGHDSNADKSAKLDVLKKVRQEVRPGALIIANTNQKTMPEIMPSQSRNGDNATPLLNGYYMESFNQRDSQHPDHEKSWTKADYERLANTLEYAQQHTSAPHITTVETWPEMGNSDGRDELSKMRATTTLVMALSDGYSLFADHDNNGKTKDHQHDWYDFYSTQVGRPLGAGAKQPDGTLQREFEKGTVVSNATGEAPIVVTFPEPRLRASDMSNSRPATPQTTFVVEPQDGDIFLKPH